MEEQKILEPTQLNAMIENADPQKIMTVTTAVFRRCQIIGGVF